VQSRSPLYVHALTATPRQVLAIIDTDSRMAWLTSFLQRCLELGNYNGVMEILTGLFKYTIHLSRAWQV